MALTALLCVGPLPGQQSCTGKKCQLRATYPSAKEEWGRSPHHPLQVLLWNVTCSYSK